ncbi:Fe-S oxidoreductase [Clostridia bacterium]|nr:Fe-S oxidoreductase [Clostridia bacterium]
MIDPIALKEIAKGYENENIKFRTFLKNHAKQDELDEQFATLHNELFASYDCCKCHNCCEFYSIEVDSSDIARAAGFLDMTTEVFTDKYTKDGEIKAPCPFLQDSGRCRIQPVKPDECVGYPYTDKPDRMAGLMGVINFAEVCPVVFEIVQQLKRIYGFRGRRLPI